MTRTRFTVDIDSTFHLPDKHNQKSHGNRAGKKDNVPSKSSKHSPLSKTDNTPNREPAREPTPDAILAPEPDDGRAARDAEVARRFDDAIQGEDAFDSLDFVTRRDLTDYVSIERGGAINGVSVEEMDVAIERYVGDEYVEVNSALRSGDKDQLAENNDTIRGVDAALSVSSTTTDIVTHRGIADATRLFGDAWNPNGNNTGLEWRDNAFVSTTTDPDVAQWFTQSGPPGAINPNSVQMRVLVPRGTPAFTPRTSRNVNIASDELPEDEIVLTRKLRYRIARDYRERDFRGNEIRKIDVEIIR